MSIARPSGTLKAQFRQVDAEGPGQTTGVPWMRLVLPGLPATHRALAYPYAPGDGNHREGVGYELGPGKPYLPDAVGRPRIALTWRLWHCSELIRQFRTKSGRRPLAGGSIAGDLNMKSPATNMASRLLATGGWAGRVGG
jgi:hypothetical protein